MFGRVWLRQIGCRSSRRCTWLVLRVTPHDRRRLVGYLRVLCFRWVLIWKGGGIIGCRPSRTSVVASQSAGRGRGPQGWVWVLIPGRIVRLVQRRSTLSLCSVCGTCDTASGYIVCIAIHGGRRITRGRRIGRIPIVKALGTRLDVVRRRGHSLYAWVIRHARCGAVTEGLLRIGTG